MPTEALEVGMSSLGTVAVRVPLSKNAVFSAAAPKTISEFGTKFDPRTVNVNGALPHEALEGLTVLMEGSWRFSVAPFETVPSGFFTFIAALPGLARRLAGTDAVNQDTLLKEVATGVPLKVAVDAAKKPEPAIVN